MEKIVIRKGGSVVREVPLADELVVGRRAGVGIQLEDPKLSRAHARVARQGNGYVVEDLKSANGTYLDGKKLEPGSPLPIRKGSVVHLAGFDLVFDVEGGAAASVAAPKPASVARPSAPLAAGASVKAERPPAPSPLLSHLIEQRESVKVWASGETKLRVADIIDETPDTKTFRFVGIEPILFSFRPGQFVTLAVEIDGKKVLRSYSISSTPSRPHTLDLTIKRVPPAKPGLPPGLVSNWLCDNLKLGDTLQIRGPSGKFTLFEYPSPKILLVGAGSGVTPLVSMARWIADTAAEVDVKMLYSARSPEDIIFRKELEHISARHNGFQVVVTVTSDWGGTECWTGFTGRVRRQMLELVAGDDLYERHLFMCGPNPFMESVKAILREMEFPIAQLHTESFGSGRVAAGTQVPPRDVPKREAAPPRSVVAAAPAAAESVAAAAPAPPEAPKAAGAFEVSFKKSGKSVKTDGQATLLELAEVNGIEIDNACRTGSCLTCKVKVASGECACDDNELEEDELKQGYILSCVARPRSNSVVIDV